MTLNVQVERKNIFSFERTPDADSRWIIVALGSGTAEVEKIKEGLENICRHPGSHLEVPGKVYIRPISLNNHFHFVRPVKSDAYPEVHEDLEDYLRTPDYQFLVLNFNVMVQSVGRVGRSTTQFHVVKKELPYHSLSWVKRNKNLSVERIGNFLKRLGYKD